ncbi:hypothetical protein N656DRAFT_844674 [Canariomyces notabilis]|uniref:Protein kinase domain-containing protein n=1 Tax=Canariomyces notabilis TaxID=2074819 RepID=A0AAN6YSU3_9PEZI|nr:hypothetical protein N656DRAFT_844674 [Canariomyces arenarius]
METVGVALGAVPLVIELFKQVINAYHLFLEGNNLEKSTTHFAMKLAIEKHRLLRWGESLGLCNPDSISAKFGSGTSIFKDEQLVKVIEQTLHCIHDIFCDVGPLTKKYGVDVVSSESGESSNPQNCEEPAPSQPTKLLRSRKRKSTSQAAINGKRPRLSLSRFQWAIRDKDAFEKLLLDLKYYNDSLHALHPPEIAITLSRDTLGSLIQTASPEMLENFGRLNSAEVSCLPYKPREAAIFQSLPQTASIALAIHKKPSSDSCFPKACDQHANGIIPWRQLHPLGELFGECRRALWQDPSGRDSQVTLVFLESVLKGPEACTYDFRKSELYQQKLMQLRQLASLLAQTGNPELFRVMRCRGITTGPDRLDIVYELPPGASASGRCLSLANILQEPNVEIKFKWNPRPSRLTLARELCSGIFHFHSCSWRHKDISSENIIFFESITGYIDIHRPYLKGFKKAQIIDETTHHGRIRVPIRQHPYYLFRKALSEAGLLPQINNYFRFRHEYYSLGLVLLELGLWETLGAIWNPAKAANHVRQVVDYCDNESMEAWKIVSAIISRTDERGLECEQTNRQPDVYDGLPSAIKQCFDHFKSAIEQEQVVEPLRETSLANDRKKCEKVLNLWLSCYEERSAYIHNTAIQQAEEFLEATMGRRYQQLVLRCLRSEFELPLSAAEDQWVRHFNWMVVRELEACCLEETKKLDLAPQSQDSLHLEGTRS